MATTLAISDLAELLFASPLQERDEPTPRQVRAAVNERLLASGGHCGPSAEYVAQEAGDHPEQYVRRMRWALALVARVYGPAEVLLAV